MIICTNCNSKIPDESTYCPMCGADIQAQSNNPTNCPFCGAENDNDAQFCINCGGDMWNLVCNEKNGVLSKKKLIAIIAIALIVLIVAGTFLFFHFRGTTEAEQNTDKKNTQTETSTPVETKGSKHKKLQESLVDYINKYGVNNSVSVYYTNLSTGEEFEHNSHSMRAGQSGRIFVLEYIMQAIKDGKMARTPNLINTIKITATGEEPSSHKLVKMITGDFAQGLDLVSQYTQEKGYKDTLINRFHGDTGNHTATTPNQTSVQDMGKCLAYIYKSAKRGDEFAKELLNILATDASPKKGLAAGAKQTKKKLKISNFEASYTECENDVAAITCKGKKIIISVMIADLTGDPKEHNLALNNIRAMSKMVCEALLQ